MTPRRAADSCACAEACCADRGGDHARCTHYPRCILSRWKLSRTSASAHLFGRFAAYRCACHRAFTCDHPWLSRCRARDTRRRVRHTLCRRRLRHGAADAGGCGACGQQRRLQQCAVLFHDLRMGVSAEDVRTFLKT